MLKIVEWISRGEVISSITYLVTSREVSRSKILPQLDGYLVERGGEAIRNNGYLVKRRKRNMWPS
tara:strand:- start:62 stop:256 length:195 start_codon:yes stop_codon:yes gene_type:complete